MISRICRRRGVPLLGRRRRAIEFEATRTRRRVLIHFTGQLAVTIANLTLRSIILANASRRLNLPPTTQCRLSMPSLSQHVHPPSFAVPHFFALCRGKNVRLGSSTLIPGIECATKMWSDSMADVQLNTYRNSTHESFRFVRIHVSRLTLPLSYCDPWKFNRRKVCCVCRSISLLHRCTVMYSSAVRNFILIVCAWWWITLSSFTGLFILHDLSRWFKCKWRSLWFHILKL